MSGEASRINGQVIFISIVTVLLLVQAILVTLVLAEAISAMTILFELQCVELMLPIFVIVLICYYQCKFSGVPQQRYSETKTRTLTTTVIIWSVLRIFQSWNQLYASRQFLGMTLLLEGYSYESYLFVPFALILQFLFIEVMPFLHSLDHGFLSKMGEKQPSSSLTERLFEQQCRDSRLNITDDAFSQMQSNDLNSGLYNNGYSPNSIMTPNDEIVGMISDAGSAAEIPYSQ